MSYLRHPYFEVITYSSISFCKCFLVLPSTVTWFMYRIWWGTGSNFIYCHIVNKYSQHHVFQNPHFSYYPAKPYNILSIKIFIDILLVSIVCFIVCWLPRHEKPLCLDYDSFISKSVSGKENTYSLCLYVCF